MAHRLVILSMLASLPLCGTSSAQQPRSDAARFSFRQMSPKMKLKHFVFEVHGKEAVDEMRAALADPKNPKRHVSGVVDQSKQRTTPPGRSTSCPKRLAYSKCRSRSATPT